MAQVAGDTPPAASPGQESTGPDFPTQPHLLADMGATPPEARTRRAPSPPRWGPGAERERGGGTGRGCRRAARQARHAAPVCSREHPAPSAGGKGDATRAPARPPGEQAPTGQERHSRNARGSPPGGRRPAGGRARSGPGLRSTGAGPASPPRPSSPMLLFLRTGPSRFSGVCLVARPPWALTLLPRASSAPMGGRRRR